MSKVAAIVKLTAALGKGAELAKGMEFALENVKTEAGTLVYILHADAANADVLWMYELYDNQDSMNAHLGSAWFAELGPKVGHLFAGAPEFHSVTPIGGKGL